MIEQSTMQRLSDSKLLRFSAHPNGSPASEGPTVGSLLIWKPQGFFKVTGHVAVVVNVTVSVRKDRRTEAGLGLYL